jgi:hypothetical protein
MRRFLKKVFVFFWRSFCSILGIFLDILWELNKVSDDLADGMEKVLIPEQYHRKAMKEAAKKKKAAEWQDDVAWFSKVPHETKASNEQGEHIRVKINGAYI